ncbi:hypothetical protein SAMN06297144_1827 [Sphingomonas guangdongensis]|uniref:DUF4148 domain-containing protein n=1 Tax=Sphingomonas guangdongensis TaxID=1141890 RepID=A0A285QZC3_9SPHN|nr:hypothetical protein [Sphingomonas guangdongensis]SOB86719.1 hypothetical protein SAMN06297144_1827 [Sphingomonas guangdongensis]
MLRAAVMLVVGSAVTFPATAQLARHGPPAPRAPAPVVIRSERLPEPGPWRDEADVRRQIERGRDEGTLTRREGRRYRREANQVGTLAERFGRDGLSDAEAAELRSRSAVLREHVNLNRLRSKRP